MRATLDVASSAFMLTAAVAILWTVFRQPAETSVVARKAVIPIPSEPLSVVRGRTLGDSRAKVGLVVFSDFECPFCGRFVRETLPNLTKTYVDTGKVFVAFRHFPLPIHANAKRAAEAAECASQQGRFWPTHDLFFGAEFSFKNADWLTSARRLVPNSAKFDECLQTGGRRADVDQDIALAHTLQIRGTPTSFVGRQNRDGLLSVIEVLPGALAIAKFREALEHALTTGSRRP